MTPAQTTTTFDTYTNNPSGGDCYAWVVAGLYWQNTTCMTCNPTSTMTLTTAQINPTCGNNNGSATVTVTGGTGPYTYTWNPGGQTTATATGLSAGTYTVTVLDNSGCVPATATVTLISTGGPTLNTVVTANEKCNGDQNGIGTVFASGGTPPYTYSWNPGGGTNSTETNLSAGTYTITVKDSSGCASTITLTITQPPPIVVTTTVTLATCNNNNGSATVTATGGSSPYTYVWNPSGQTTATATGLSVGTYTVTVTDNNGCSNTGTATITAANSPTVTVTNTTNELCNGGTTGSGTVSVSGGSTPYTYLWNPGGGSNATESGLSAGTYTITVTDANGCTTSTTITISQPAPIVATMTMTAATCGNNNGSAGVTASGGTGPYTYIWNPGGETTASISGLSAGTYTVTVTDNKGCTQTNSVTITTNSGITLTSTITDGIKCDGDATGSATITATGGTTPYTYSWNPGGGTNATESGLTAGSYTVTVTDNMGCNTTIVVTITQPAILTAPISTLRDISCFGLNNGMATVTPSGGTPAYTYLWTPLGNTTNTITGLSGGTYTIEVTDANGCSLTSSIIISQPPAISVTFTSTPSNCGNNDGTASVTVTGGTAPYTYYWSPSAETTATATGLSTGSYTVTVTDFNGCNVVDTVVVGNTSTLNITTTTTNPLCNGGNTGSATVTASGGTAPYTYLWNPGGGSTASISNLSAGTYTISVTDNSGCTQSTTVTITQPAPIDLSTSSTGTGCINNTGSATVNVIGGTAPYTYLWNPGGGTTASISNLSAGTYTVTVTDNNGCSQSATVTVTQPGNISLITTATVSACSANTGSASVTVSGGTGPYTYLWNPSGGTTSLISGLSGGSYTVMVTDANGCSATALAVVPSATNVSGSITSSTNDLCFGSNIGSATVTVTSGIAPYTYTWNPGGQTTATATGLSTGTYTVTVADSSGCSFTASVNIGGPSSPISETHVITNTSCNSTSNGFITLTVSGGTPQYTFTWSNGSTNENLSNILPGSYTVSIKDSNGCSLVDSMRVGFDSSVIANAGRDTILCHNSTIALNGTGSLNATSYQWFQMPGMIPLKDSSVIYVTPSNDTTTYVLVVENGLCFDTSRVTIVLAPVVFADAGPDQTILGNGTVTIGGSPTGPGGSSYFWSPNGTLNDSILSNPSATPSVTTIYTVTVKNSAGCLATDTVTIFVLPGVTVPTGFTPNADGTNDTWVLNFASEFPNIVVEIYNRWGEMLFHSDGYYTPWDGTYNGKPLPVGTYYYIIKLNDPRFPNAQTGPVTIMR